MMLNSVKHRSSLGLKLASVLVVLLLASCATDTGVAEGDGEAEGGSQEGDDGPSADADAADAAEETPEEGEEAPEDYFAGQTVQVIAGQEAGGAYDLAARILAPLLEEYLPGEPRVQVVNVPGAGHLRGHRELYESDPDGFTVAPIHSRWLKVGLAVELGLEEEIEGFDPFDVRYIGTYRAARRDAGTCINADLGNDWEDVLALGRPVTLGVSERGGTASLPAELIEYHGGPVQIVEGYSTGSEAREAYARGETDLAACAQRHIKGEPWADTLEPLWWFNEEWDSEFVAEMGWPEDIPHFYDVWDLDESDRLAFDAMVDVDVYSGAWALPPGTSDEIVETWTTAFEAAATDDRFVDRYVAEGRDPGYSPPEPIYELRDAMASLPEEAIELFAALAPE